ncbi:D-methionine transport system substrate-binding protein [Seinonella peptonophila]|uniref:Lipoprotein n=1 Tax=Seinonella peptonophila TaxID=112248 RepID=A0A1M4U3Q7_9BACL|nr:MetQ/NlpA family ABC transporter substrate-binding protein [Seinonella peptonophila]SHE51368.1 D-methionine transport system substrate-binding protein [Seinonella peptonophila]
MKKFFSIILLAILVLTAIACNQNTAKKEQILTVAASQVPHSEILEHVKPILQEEGIHLEIKVFQDYVIPNKVVNEGKADANFFQHVPYMEEANQKEHFQLVKVTGVHIEPLGGYSKKIKKIEQLTIGAKVAVPSDASNLTRALLLLDQNNIIKLDNRNGNKTERNIVSNPKQLKVQPLEAAMLPRVLDQVDLAVINTNYALQAKLNPTKDSLIIEDKNSPYVNILATTKAKQNDPAIQKLAKALNSPEVKQFIKQKYKGAIVPAF